LNRVDRLELSPPPPPPKKKKKKEKKKKERKKRFVVGLGLVVRQHIWMSFKKVKISSMRSFRKDK
jgi:hypothetical protein